MTGAASGIAARGGATAVAVPAGSPRRFIVGRADDLPAGARMLVEVPPVGEVGIFNVGGEFFAVRNLCPHMGGPMCRGRLTGTTRPRFSPGRRPELEWIRDGEILRCPWHAWEFDIRTGKALFSDRTRIAVYDVHVGEDVGEDVGGDVDEAAVAAEPPGDAETYPVHVEARHLVLELPDRRRRDDARTEEDGLAG